MSINGGSGSGKALGAQSIPAGSRKVVQSLKEIVNCPDHEIYAMLKECQMDPNEAVNRLLSQDPFHEVKSKREKKKESKDFTDFRSRSTGSGSNHGSRNAIDRYGGRGPSTQLSSPESGGFYPKYTHKKENGSSSFTSSLHSVSGAMESSNTRQSLAFSDSTTETNLSTKDVNCGISSAMETPGYHPVSLGFQSQMSMADIVKMGRPQSKIPSAPNSSYSANHKIAQRPSAASYSDLHSTEDHVSMFPELHPEPIVTSSQHHSFKEQFQLDEQQPTSNVPSSSEPDEDTETGTDPSKVSFDKTKLHPQSQRDKDWLQEDSNDDCINANHISLSIREAQEDISGGDSPFDSNSFEDPGSLQPQNHTIEDVSVLVSSATANLQQLNIQNEDQEALKEEDSPCVKIPNHLQVQTADCFHLSFGSFGSGSIPLSVPLASKAFSNEATNVEAPRVGHSDVRNSGYYGEESLTTASNGNLAHRTIANGSNYDSVHTSQSGTLMQENSEMVHGNQYALTSSSAGRSFENGQPTFNESQPTSQMQNLAQFSSAVQAYTNNSLPSALLATNIRPVGESDLSYSPFPITQPMPTKYGNGMSSIGSSTISMPEVLKTVGLSLGQPTPQTLPGSNGASGTLQQRLGVHPYSQPTLPLAPFANMISYPFLPQSYTYMPPAYQQAFAGGSTYHQALAAMLPQYKNNASVTSLPQSAAIPSGYGAFGSSTTIPGSFTTNTTPSAAVGTTVGYDDIIGSQYKDNIHLLSLQQSENLAMWLHGPGSRTMSAVPASTYYSFQGQNQQHAGFQQGQQQPSQNCGTLGYPNFYHSQAGMTSIDHHPQQHSRDGSLGASQGQPKQSQQLWQNNY